MYFSLDRREQAKRSVMENQFEPFLNRTEQCRL